MKVILCIIHFYITYFCTQFKIVSLLSLFSTNFYNRCKFVLRDFQNLVRCLFPNFYGVELHVYSHSLGAFDLLH